MKSKSLLTVVCGLFFFFAKSQTSPVFTGGTTQTLSICQNSGVNSIDTKMVTTDPDAGQTLTYTIASAPVHGTVHGFPGLTSTGAGGIVSPSGFDYAPASGYNGLDSFIVNVNDGTFSGQTKIKITVNALPTVAAITGTPSACLGGTSQLANTTTGGVWSSSNVFVADISGTGLVTPQAAGTAVISYTVTNGSTGCSNAATVNFSVGAYPVVQPITGTATVCAGLTTQLSSLTSGGVWTSNNNTRATVNASTGLVTGVSAGAVTITYTVTNAAGCSTAVTRNITVNASPTVGNITATTTTICVGSTTTLTDATNGGTWSSSNTSIATVTNGGGPGGGGTVTGIAAGVDTISYTVTNGNGCTNSTIVEITVTNGVTVAPITGPTTVCNGKTITLSDVTTSGTWSITTGGFRATINQAGVLTATAAGAVVVTYSVIGGGGCSKSVTYNVTVSNAPTLAAITGSNQVCVGTTTTLSNSTAGGTWTSKNTSIATITNGGAVTGVAAGSDTIVYIVTNGAGCSDTVSFLITVTSSITVNPITGGSSVCTGSTLLLSNTTAGGLWASSDNTIAIVIGGTVTPIKAGVVAITYTVGSGACSGVASKNIIINPSPSVGTIDGNTGICVGSTSQLSNTTTDGVWSSSNTNIASISATGLVTPANIPFSQNATISYTVTNSYGCTAASTAIVTVNPRPNVQAIAGTNSTCVGSLTTFTVSTPAGGVWSSFSNNTIAQPVTNNPSNSSSVIGISPGTDTIYYTVTNGNGCETVVSRVVTISNTLVVAPIVGSTTACIGSTPTPTYTNTTTGGVWSSNSSVITINATSGLITAVGPGTGAAIISYFVDKGGTCTATQTINVTVSNRPGTPTISPANSVCVDASITLTGNPTGGNWALQVAAFSNYLSLDPSTGIASALASPPGGQVGVNYTVSNAAGCTRTSNNYNITVNAGPNIGQIQPNPLTVCVGVRTTLTNSTPSGTWEVANTALATVVADSGIITGVAAGNTLVRYTVTNATGCASVASRIVTVNTTPNAGALSGQNNVCVGSSTTFIATVVNGTWSSSNTAVATVSNGGVVTGTGVGSATITYTVSAGGAGGCSASATKSITVNSVPIISPITTSPIGQSSICINSTLQLYNATTGGAWASSNTARATVDGNGLVTGVSAGAIIITYTVTNGTCSATAFGNGTVYALPTVATILGSSSVCVGSTIKLTNDTTGGVWSSDNTAIATVSSTGVVSGLVQGSATISYTKTNSNGCVKTITKTLSVNALPIINSITGTTSLCVGAITTLSNNTASGAWASDNTSIATINNSGVVTGLSAGVVAIKYLVTNVAGCTDSVSTNVTVNALPLVASIGGNTSVCIGSSTILTNATTAGVWSSSNTAVGTISSGGVVIGLSAGTTTIKYQVTNAGNCIDSTTLIFTVNSLPIVAAITGNTPVCVGSTRALANTTAGGVWSSSNAAIATVNGSGLVLGLSAGNAIIKYQITNGAGCTDSVTTLITVSALPTVAALTGVNTVCVGSTTTYSSTTASGVWSSGNNAIATVNAGVITGVAAGTTTISYAVTNVDGCTNTVTKTVAVNALPTVSAISGSSSLCIGSTTTYSSTPTTGVWTSDNIAVATVGSSTGIVAGVSAGTATITYTVSNASGCIKSVTKVITVNSLPTASFTINNNSQCVNTNSFVFTNTSVSAASSVWNFGDATTSTSTSSTKTFAAAGAYNVKLVITNNSGCKDSITQSVTVKSTSISTTNISICPSDLPYVWNGLTFNTAGSQTAHLTNAVGCDSAATLNLTVKATSVSTTNISICPSALPYTWNSLTFNAAGSQTAHLTNAAGCDSAATLNLAVKATSTSTTNISICPSALPYTWNSLSFNAAGSQTAHLTNSVNCDSAATLNLTVKATSSSTTNISICPSALSYTWNSLTFNAAGSQTAHLTNAAGCDSAATLNLAVKATSTSTTNISICPSALPYTWNSLSFSAAGTQTAHLTNSVGCDSAATLNLTVKANTTSTSNISICPSALPYTWNSLSFSAAGSQTAHLTNASGCDSAATLNLTVKATSTSNQSFTACDSYVWNGTTYTTSGTYVYHTLNSVGCDSAATLVLTVNNSTTSSTTITNCDSYVWNGVTYTASGDYTVHFTNAANCDSAATLHLTITHSTISSTTITNCDSYVWNGVTYTASGDYTVHFTNAANCDSAATLHLTITHSTTSSTTITNCDSYVWNGVTYTASGDYTVHFTNAANCDSAATLHLTITHSTTSSTSITNCDSYVWNGVTYTASGDYTVHFTNAANCDSAATLHLTITHSTTSSTTITNCDSYVWNGVTYTASGDYTVHFTNAANCDSAATLHLTITHSTTSSTTITNCDSYVWNGVIYTTSGDYTVHFTNAENCDSAATLHLTITHSTTSSTSITICDSYVWNGVTYTASGDYTVHFTNAENCDSAATLHLTITHSTTSSTTITNCDSYVWNGVTYTASGDYTVHFTNAENCDSAATLHLTITHSTTSSTSITICSIELPYSWNGLTFAAAGSQTYHTLNSVGCDSAATLVLTVNANPIVPAINGTPMVCIGNTTPLSNTTAGGVWSSLDNSVATIDASGVVTGVSAGTSLITYTVTNASNCTSIASINVMVNTLPTVAAITGSNQVCIGATTTLSNDTLGGVWTCLTPATATITSAGVVTGVSVGGTTIKYTVADVNGCSTTVNHIMTVNGLPPVASITGTNTVCVGATTTLSNTTASGVWASGNTAVATIDASGVVTGVSSGVTIITYTVTNVATGCTNSTSTSVTVSALPTLGIINGSSSICISSTTTLSNTTLGGSWSSSNTAVATIDNGGIVTPGSAGTTTITYIVSNASGCVDSVSKLITVNDLPVVTAITGAPSVCAGSNATYSNITANGTWISSNTSVATINSVGLVNAIAAGTSTISYTVTDAATTCSTVMTQLITVNTPAVAPITGVNSLCPASTSTLSTTTTGGVWSSSNAGVATVDATTGLVTGIANGVTTITYKVPVGNVCGDSASTIVSVNPTLVVAPITGDTTICHGSTSVLNSTTSGGSWISNSNFIASIGPIDGVVRGQNPGTVTIRYIVLSNAGCQTTITTTVTVNALPAPVSFVAPTTLCKGATVSLIPSVNGGVWNSSPNNIVFVDNAGNANGVGAGVAMVSYHTTNASGCSSDTLIKSITVVDLPVIAAIAGNNTVCLGSTTTLTNDSTGGVWSSSNASVLTIDGNGVVTPVAAGSATVNYTITNAASCATTVTKTITVFDIPTVGPIVGGNSVCVGSTITLASPTSNGVWSSVTPFVASINNAGVLTGNFSGGTTIKYTLTDAITTCTNSANLVVTVNALPVVPAIAGASAVCLNNSTTLSNTAIGGTWSSSNASIATIDNAGVVIGVGAGTSTITYNVTNASSCSSIVTTDITVNVVTASSTAVSVCNNMLPYTWNGSNYNTAGTYTYTTTNANGCDSIASLVLTVKDTTISSATVSTCETYTWNGIAYTTSGTYIWKGTNVAGCDSIATLILTINNGTHNVTTQTACDSYTWNGTSYTASGTYIHSYNNGNGCASVDTLHLTINNSTHNVTTQTACDSYTWNGTNYTASGTYTYSYNNGSACASVDTLYLTINNSTHNVTTQTACDSYTWNGTTYTFSGTYTYSYNNGNGCASFDTLHLTINNSTHNVTTQTACDSYTWNGTTYTGSGTYTYSYDNGNGCASVDTLKLTINQSTHNVTTTTVCNSYIWHSRNYTASTVDTFSYFNSNGCFSVDTLKLTINTGTHNIVTTSSCDSMIWNGTVYYASGTYTYSYNNSNGCASVDTLNLTINTTPAKPVITTSTNSIISPATGVAYGCSSVTNAVYYTWSYTGTGATVASGQGTENILVDFAANATSGYIQVNAYNATGCTSANDTVFVTTTPLPVVLSSFTAEKVNTTALLKWSTATEINSKNFEVQRSIDGRNFVTIATVTAKGTASEYSFVDEKPFVGVNYYRLKQVDNDGKFAISTVKQVKFDSDVKFVVNIYPNPAKEILNVKVSNADAKQIRIFNSIGKTVYATNVVSTNNQIPVGKLTTGAYFVEITTVDGSKQVEKFIKK